MRSSSLRTVRTVRTVWTLRTLGAAGALCGVALSQARAEDDPRGQRGVFIAFSPTFSAVRGVDDAGRETPSLLASGGWVRFGEEVVDGLTLGLELGGLGGQGSNFSASLGGFTLQATWRPGVLSERLVLLVGAGVGGVGLTPDDADASPAQPSGSGGGALLQAGAHYELDLFGGPREGFAFGPALHGLWVPDTADNPVTLAALSLGLEAAWYFGR